ncbi:hypothetical protein KIN20_032665 [Parelaphostrongylus tenuis]|uniref:C2H2-type domain-containing protein n=1 Tax=Parelaphostrongylus tenuis TaxID=148309 RepID=A0AAD5WI71_PARTN|nr:hypothetical protein KIN20_032665 [Parelaphostrongylus tenuis]
MIEPNHPPSQSKNRNEEANSTYDGVPGVDCKPETTLLPLSEIQALSEQQNASRTSPATSSKPVTRTRVRKRPPLQPLRTRDRHKALPLRTFSDSDSVIQASNSVACNSLLVTEAIKLIISKGSYGGYVEYLRSNDDGSIKRSFEKVKKELVNKQSFSGSSSSAERYLQAARILYNRLDWKTRRKYEYAARQRARIQHILKPISQKDSRDHEPPLFVNNPDNSDYDGAEACAMPSSEYVFMDRRSKDDFVRYEALLSRRLHCPLCPVSAEKLANAVQYQLHMLEYHSCAHLCMIPVMNSQRTLIQHVNSSGEVELTMKFAIMLLACTDCGSQLHISSSYIGESSIKHWDEIISFHALHNCEKIVPLMVYSVIELPVHVRLRIHTMTFPIEGVQVDCPYCGLNDFESVDSLESHFLSHEESNKKCCPVCSKQFSQEAFYREHLLSHLGVKSCYLAVYLSRFCTFITGGVPSCGPNLRGDSSRLVYGGVSSAIFTTKLWKEYVDPWESVTVRKKLNRVKRKRRTDPDEADVEDPIYGENCVKLKKLIADGFDFQEDLKANRFFYTGVNSEEETEHSSKLYNSSEIEYECITDEQEHGNASKLALDMSQKFSTNCRLLRGKMVSKKHNVIHTGLLDRVLMCRRCQCLCTGESSTYSHLSYCCPELRRVENSSAPYDLENGLLVLCVSAKGGFPNSKVECWECSSMLCSIFGLRVHMIIHHGIFLKTEGSLNDTDVSNEIPAIISTTTRAINLSIGLTADGCLPVNLEERKKMHLPQK